MDDMAFLDAQRAKVGAINLAAAQAEEQAAIVMGLRQRMDQIDAMVNVNAPRSIVVPSKYTSEYEGLQTTFSSADTFDPLNLSATHRIAGTASLLWSPATVGADPEVEMWRQRSL